MQIKAPNPSLLLENKGVNPIIRLYFEVNFLKNLYRQGWLETKVMDKYCESVAEHCFSMAILSMLIRDKFFPNLDLEKILTMCLVHEFGEINAGDITPAAGISNNDLSKLERAGVESILMKYDGMQRYIDIWHEFEAGVTSESKLVKQIDKLDMAFQARVYSLQHKLNLDEFMGSARKRMIDPEISALLDEIEKLS